MQTDQKLIDFLVKGNFVTDEELSEFEKIGQEENKTLDQILIDKEIFSEQQMGQILADIYEWRFVDLQREAIDKNTIELIPEDIAKTQKVVAFGKTEDGIKIATTDPNNMPFLHLLQKSLHSPIIPYFALLSGIQKCFYYYQKDLKGQLEKLIDVQSSERAGGNVEESAVVKIVELLLYDSYKQKASDIHIEPQQFHTLVRCRIDGVMHDIIVIPKNLHDLIITRVKILSQLRTDEHQIPQDGKFQYRFEGEEVDIRVSILPTTKGENIVMRLLSEKSRRYSLEDLGFNERDYNVLRENIKKPWGMILATGPTGSGKTTSLYAILKILNRREVNIATIEDPVEYNIGNITQIQVNPRTKLTFASGLRSIVRQDPNIIMVGEIRDEETASIAVNSAMTGHLVLSTLHTNDAATTLPRLLDMGIPSFLVASTVNIAIGQRLIRKICNKCIMSYEISKSTLEKRIPENIVNQLMGKKTNLLLYKGKGCPVCQYSGYSGRVGVFEVLEVNDSIRELIINNADADTIKKRAIQNGMRTMFEDAVEKVVNGITTVEEMLRVVKY